MSEATYLAWRQPDVRMFAQFLLRDIGPDESVPERSPERWADYQTGLITHDGQPKPSLNAFKLPFWVERAVTDDGTEGLLAFGQVRPGQRPAPDGDRGARRRTAGCGALAPCPSRHVADEDCASLRERPAGLLQPLHALCATAATPCGRSGSAWTARR